MKKRKYEYTHRQEEEILDAANFAIGVVGVIVIFLMMVSFSYMVLHHTRTMITGIAITAITTFIFVNYRAWVVVNHRINVKSQDDNIE